MGSAQARPSFPITDTSLLGFASPGQEAARVGIDSNMISPIPNRASNDLGGVSVNKYVDVSHISNEGHASKHMSPYKDSKRHTDYSHLVPAENSHAEINRSRSPARDLV